MIRWTLKRGADRRFREGHPWIFSNELVGSPKGVMPGETIELFDYQGAFLARGYGHPNSLIAFREMTRDPAVSDPFDVNFLAQSLERAQRVRHNLGLAPFSYRLCFGEGDGFSGLIIDRYASQDSQVFVLQAQTAGMDRNIIRFVEALNRISHESQNPRSIPWERTGIVIKNDSKMRALEGLKIEECRVEKSVEGVNFSNFDFSVRSAARGQPVVFTSDIINGQKTGFFLDQSSNVDRLIQLLIDRPSGADSSIRALDICCYVGQWSSQISSALRTRSEVAHCTLFDASQVALDLAQKNVERAGGSVEAVCGDALKDLGKFSPNSFDVVVCDPPAFIKGRKDLGPGQHAYMKLNEAAMRLIKPGGVFVSCSCSGLLTDSDFQSVLAKSSRRAQKTFKWIAKGSQGVDHPMSMNFTEGTYLKSWFAVSTN